MPGSKHKNLKQQHTEGSSVPLDPNAVPKLVVFDLDYTLWPFWCDTHVTPPIRPSGGEHVLDKYGDQFAFYPEVPQIFKEIQAHPDMRMCAASRTHAPRVAQSLLSMLHVDGEPSSTFFAFTAWGTGSKIRHFQELHLHTGVAYDDMLFFDDEGRNRDVHRQLNVCFVEVHSGMTLQVFHNGIAKWRKHKHESGNN